MIENFITAFIVYFLVIDPVDTTPIFLAITSHLNKRQKIRTALEGTFVAGAIMLFFALCGVWILHYLNISLTAFRLAGGIILLMVALDMLANKRQARREEGNDTFSTDDSDRFFRQIASLRQRLRLIAIIQTCSSVSYTHLTLPTN